jgi:hypothetical protein
MKNNNVNNLEHETANMIFDTTNIHVEHDEQRNELFIELPATELDTEHLNAFIKTLNVDQQTSYRIHDMIVEMVERETFLHTLMKQRK